MIFAFLRLWGRLDGCIPVPDEKPKLKPNAYFSCSQHDIHTPDIKTVRLAWANDPQGCVPS
ncbi:hypothetical protein K439DRAFT_1643154 [Ramaria rubella]|nr:hypothetical protein K439DRAFT_1643154 [Ramaria rubella]